MQEQSFFDESESESTEGMKADVVRKAYTLLMRDMLPSIAINMGIEELYKIKAFLSMKRLWQGFWCLNGHGIYVIYQQ